MSISARNLANDDCKDSTLSHSEGELLNLVPDGNATLVVSHAHGKLEKRFLVSTTVLSLASRYFDRLFNGHMAEAQKLSDGEPVSVDLDEDDPEAVELILRVLHHQAPNPSINLDPSLIASIALHADKYDTCIVLQPWVTHWLDALQPTGKSAVDIGLPLLATHMVRARFNFTLASKVAARDLANGFERLWSTHELLQHIPDATIDQLSEKVRSMARQSRRLVEGVKLLSNETVQRAKKCHPCNNTDLRQLYCTCELRVSDYMGVLRQVELWGSSTPLEFLAASEIRSRMSCAYADVKHNCDAGLSCPLRIQIGVVGDSLQRLLDNCSGMSLGE